jgi:hypothetical protein
MPHTMKSHSPAHRRARHMRRARRHCSAKHHRSPHRVSARTRKMHKKFCKRHRRKTARKHHRRKSVRKHHRRKTARKHHRRKSARKYRGGDGTKTNPNNNNMLEPDDTTGTVVGEPDDTTGIVVDTPQEEVLNEGF